MQNKNQSFARFFVLVFILVIPFLVLQASYPVELLPGLPLSALGAFMPALAALILTYRQDRLSGVRQLLGRCFDFKRITNPRWFIPILLIPPVIAVFAYAVMRLSGRALPDLTPMTGSILPLLILFFIAALGEELGWTGYATAPLLQCWGTLPVGLLLGGVWAVIHFIPLTQAHRSFEWIVWWTLGTICYRVIITWLYVHSGRSLFGAAVFHSMINLSWQLFPNHGSYYDPQIFGVITLLVAIVLYVIERLLLRHQKNFTTLQIRSFK